MSASRLRRTSIALAILVAGASSACSGDKQAKPVETTTVPVPRAAPNVEPCLLSQEEVKKATGMDPVGPGEGAINSCWYSLTPKGGGEPTRFEIRVKPWVSDISVLEAEKVSRPNRKPIEFSDVSQGMVTFEPDTQFADLPVFIMTTKGYVFLNWVPARQIVKDDGKTSISLGKAVAKKLDSLPIEAIANG